MVNQVPKYQVGEEVLKYSPNHLNNNGFGGVFLPWLAAIRKSLLYLENQMMRLDLGYLFNDILRYNIIINGQNHFHAQLIITLQYFSSDWRELASQATPHHTTLPHYNFIAGRTGHWTLDTGHWIVDSGHCIGQWTLDTGQWIVIVDTGQ